MGIFLSAAAAIRAVQSEKQSSPMETAGDRMSFVRTMQSLKAARPIDLFACGARQNLRAVGEAPPQATYSNKDQHERPRGGARRLSPLLGRRVV